MLPMFLCYVGAVPSGMWVDVNPLCYTYTPTPPHPHHAHIHNPIPRTGCCIISHRETFYYHMSTSYLLTHLHIGGFNVEKTILDNNYLLPNISLHSLHSMHVIFIIHLIICWSL